jgi:hypothetical protein
MQIDVSTVKTDDACAVNGDCAAWDLGPAVNDSTLLC